MAEALYMDDCYLTEFEATVKSAKEKKIILDRTAFYPNSGGQLGDQGILERNGEKFTVANTIKESGEIVHETDKEGLKQGDRIKGQLDWERRYKQMRYHTAAHIISGIFNKETGAMITGNQLNEDHGRIDFNLEAFDREKMTEYFEKANEIVRKKLPIKTYYMPREETENHPEIFKLVKQLPDTIKKFRIVDIEGFDRQADGGTHVKNTSEVGKIEFIGAENKGKNNRRVMFRIC